MLLRCGVQFEFRYIKGLKKPPPASLIVGGAVHKGAEFAFKEKLERKEIPPEDIVTDITRQEIEGRINNEGVKIDEEISTAGKGIKGVLIDRAVALTKFHYRNLLPRISPVLIEKEFKIKVKDFPFILAGKIDLIDAEGRLRDLKTSRNTPSSLEVKKSLQLTLYALPLFFSASNNKVKVGLDYLVYKDEKIKLVQLESFREKEQFVTLLEIIKRAGDCIKKGVFLPALPGSWWCSEKWCGYWEECKLKIK